MRTLRHSVTEAIVLRRRSVGEKDRSILLFTRVFGLVWATARGVKNIRSKRSPHLEPLNETVVTLHANGTFMTITDATAKTMYGIQTTSFLKLRAYFLLAEIIERLLPLNAPHPETYRLMTQTCSDIYHADEAVVPFIVEKSLSRLLIQLGYIGEDQKHSLSKLLSIVETIIERKLRTIGAFRSSGRVK